MIIKPFVNLTQNALRTDDGINYTNIVLMLLSLFFSFFFPFETFLFAYAFIGPLHYLTEISWLEKRSFFMPNKKDIWIFILLGILFTLPVFFEDINLRFYGSRIMMLSFFLAILFVFLKNTILKYATGIISFLVIMSKKDDYSGQAFIWFGVMLPTIIHVFLFTGMFILSGALKQKSKSGFFSLLVFVLCALFLLYFNTDFSATHLSKFAERNLVNFEIINRSLILLFGFEPGVTDLQTAMRLSKDLLFLSPHAVAIARFVAFAYSYHYLNWFSKTSVIKWHETSRFKLVAILIIWLIAIGIYLIDYQLGFKVLFLLSIMHVMFEFPLNILVFKNIGSQLKTMFSK